MRLPDDSQAQGETNDPGFVTPPPQPQPTFATRLPDPGSTTAQPVLACDECGAPVDPEQRYCVVCGAHRRNVNDPATHYLSQASAKSRRAKSSAAARRSPRFGGSRGVILALVIALIPAAAAAGVIAGRSSNNDDSHLIQALKQHQSAAGQTTTVQAKAGTLPSTAVASSAKHHAAQTTAKSNSSTSSKDAKGSKGSKGSKRSKGSTSGSSGGQSNPAGGPTSAPKIVGFKATKSQQQTGANVTQKVQKSTGKNFVNGQNSLPGEVVVP